VDGLFARHGGKAVFAGRFFSVSRVLEALVAGTSRMHWGMFVFYSVLGGTIWATAVVLAGSSLPGWTIHRISMSPVEKRA
jgi:membrane protein DedA with SNARE-associated domain